MSLTPDQAVDESLALLNTMWSLTGFEIKWPEKAETPPETQDVWARVKIEHLDSKKVTLGDVEGKALWERKARIIVQICFPLDKSLNSKYTLPKQVIDVFEGKKTPGGVRFLNPVMNELGVLDGWLRINVVTTMKYEEYK